jgi:uncharacterized membrane protein (UPF0182 family)
VQPIFVQSSAVNSIPLLQKVAVYYNNEVGYATDLKEAVAQVIGDQQPTPPPADGSPTPTPTPATGNDQQLLQQADAAYKAAQQDLKNGDLAGYQRNIERMASLLQQALRAQGGNGSGNRTTTTTTAAP